MKYIFNKCFSSDRLGMLVSTPLAVYNARRSRIEGSLAQLVEHRTFNPLVLGSNPRRPTIILFVYPTFVQRFSNTLQLTGIGIAFQSRKPFEKQCFL